MFNNRAIQLHKNDDKDSPTTDVTVEYNHLDPEQIMRIIGDQTRRTVLLIGAVMSTKLIVNTICEVAVVMAKTKIR